MDGLRQFVARMNLPVWLVGIFAGHAAMYLMLGTATWFTTALLATAFYGVVLFLLRSLGRRERVR